MTTTSMLAEVLLRQVFAYAYMPLLVIVTVVCDCCWFRCCVVAEAGGEVEARYPYPLSRLLVNAVTAGLAVFLMFLLVREFVPLLVFVVSACLLTAFRFFVKVRYVYRMAKLSSLGQGDVRKSLVERSRRVMLLGLLAIVVSLPLLILATRVLPVYVWLTVTATVASGFGLSEVLFYVYCMRRRSEVSREV